MADNVDWAKRIKRAFMFPGTDASEATAWAFDCVIRESHHSELTVTDNPVETGVVISDHAFMGPLGLTIEADVGDVWLHAKDANGNPVPDVWGSPAGRSVSAFSMMQGLQASAVPFAIQTGLKFYENMLITTLDVDQDVETANVARFRAQLREVQFVSTQAVTYPPRAANKTTRQASKTVSGGEKKTATPPPQQLESSLSSLTGAGQVPTGLSAALGGS